MTLNQASRKLDSDLLLAVNGSGLPLRVVELQVINLLSAVQMGLRQEEEKEAPASGLFERAKRRVRNFFEKIYRALRKLAFSFLAFCGKLKETAHKAEKAKEWFSDEKNQESLQLLLRQARRLAAHGLPRRGSGEITFGFEDPGLTGQVLAAASLVYPFCHRQLKLYPVFDRRILEGQFDFRGRIRSAYVLWLAWEIYRDKHTWRMIRRWLRRG